MTLNFLEPYEEKTSYTVLRSIVNLHLFQWVVYQIIAIDVGARREGRDQTYLNVPTILYFLEKGAQPTRTVPNILKKAGVFIELHLNP